MDIDPLVLQLIGRQQLTIEILTGQIRRLKAEKAALQDAKPAPSSNEDAGG